MGYEQTPFGDGSSAGSGNVLGTVSNHYGRRDTGGTVGTLKTEGAKKELVIDLTGESLNQSAGPVLVSPTIPKGAKITSVYLEVSEEFALGGTTPAVEVGTQGSEATNGVTLNEAQLEAVGTYDVTSALSGTWASIFTADTLVDVALSGTSPTVDKGKGVGRVLINYDTTA